MRTRPAKTSRLLAVGVGFIFLFIASFTYLLYWIGESFRHNAHEPGDAGLGFAFGFAAASLFMVLGGFLIRLGLRSELERKANRLVAATFEGAVGAAAVLWLLPVFTLPVAVVSFRVAGSMRRQLAPEPKLRDLTGDARWSQLFGRYGPYLVTALVTCVMLWLGIWLVVVGGACHLYDFDGWTACERDGSLIGSVVAIGLISAVAGLAINIGYRLRGPWPRPGWPLAISIGTILAGVIATSHLLS